MKQLIENKLFEIEQEQKIKILYACESGSRAWGFPSSDSDYDVRFIYIRPAKWYFTIDDQKDILDFPINDVLDINGWDIRKALKLFRSSNAVIYEWLQSPIVYAQHLDFQSKMEKLFGDFFSLRAGMHHYLSMTMNLWKNDLQNEEVRLKKYFYALRTSLCCTWIMIKGSAPPMELSMLRQLIADQKELNKTIDIFLKQKLYGDEKDTIVRNSLLNHFIQETISEAEGFALTLEKTRGSTTILDELFRQLSAENF